MIHPEQERVRKLLTEAVTLLCRNSLQFEEEVVVEGLIGITLDRSDILLISIRESVQQTLREVTSSIRSDKEPVTPASPGKRKRRKRSHDSDSDAPPPATPPVKKQAPSMTDDEDNSRPDPEPRLNMKVKKESPEDDEDHDDRNTSQNERDGRSIHPAHDSTSRDGQMTLKQEPSGSNHSTDSRVQPVPNQQTLPTDAVRVKEEMEEEPDECYVIDSDDDDMSNSSASNSMSLNMLENQLQMASQNWASVDDGSGFDINNIMQQGQNWSNQFNQGQQMPGGNQGNMSFMGSPQPGTSQDAQRLMPRQKGVFMCPLCGKLYNYKQSLQHHLRRAHRADGSVHCPNCTRSFPNNGEMKRHMLACSGQAHFQCAGCNTSFTYKSNLQRHMRRCAALNQ